MQQRVDTRVAIFWALNYLCCRWTATHLQVTTNLQMSCWLTGWWPFDHWNPMVFGPSIGHFVSFQCHICKLRPQDWSQKTPHPWVKKRTRRDLLVCGLFNLLALFIFKHVRHTCCLSLHVNFICNGFVYIVLHWLSLTAGAATPLWHRLT